MNYKIENINLTDDLPECKNPTEIVSCVMSVCNQIFPNMQPGLTGFDGMNDYQIAYSLSKVLYDQVTDEADQDTERECKRREIPDDDLDTWSKIQSKYDAEYAVNHFMCLKWQAEKIMVEYLFRVMDASKNVQESNGQSKADYERVKAQWERPAIRQKVIDLAFKLRT